jgi:hypothetical protein
MRNNEKKRKLVGNDNESEENVIRDTGMLEMPAAEKKAACQHSKRELKKKGLAELEAVLAEFGLSQNDENLWI